MATKKYDTSEYDNLYNAYATSVDQNLAAQKQAAQSAAASQLKQAYINRVQNEKRLQDNLAVAGIRGGATETSMLRLENDYGKQRSSIGSSLSDSIREYDLAADQNKLAYKQDIDAKKLAYVENMQAEERANAREDALRKEDFAREDKLRKKEIAREDQLRKEEKKETQQREYWTAKYGKVYNLNTLKSNLKKAKTTTEKAIINARIAYLSDKSNEVAYKQAKKATKNAKKKSKSKKKK